MKFAMTCTLVLRARSYSSELQGSVMTPRSRGEAGVSHGDEGRAPRAAADGCTSVTETTTASTINAVTPTVVTLLLDGNELGLRRRPGGIGGRRAGCRLGGRDAESQG